MFEQNKYIFFYPVSGKKTDSSVRPELIEGLQSQLAEIKDKFVRVSADFENYKRRMQKEQTQWFDLGQTKVLTALLNIVDDFDRACASGSADEGIHLIYKSLQKLLESFEVKEIPANIPFDPEMHEGLVSVEASGKQSGDVVEILQKGYTYKGKVLRPAKVSVAK